MRTPLIKVRERGSSSRESGRPRRCKAWWAPVGWSPRGGRVALGALMRRSLPEAGLQLLHREGACWQALPLLHLPLLGLLRLQLAHVPLPALLRAACRALCSWPPCRLCRSRGGSRGSA